MTDAELLRMLHQVDGCHYDREGNPISMWRCMELMRDDDYRIVAQTRVGPLEISTVWLGQNHNRRSARPLIFETMGFIDGHVIGQARYATIDEARAAHDGLVALARERLAANQPLTDVMPGTIFQRLAALLELDSEDEP